MKTNGILHSRLAGLMAGLGHKDKFMIVDCGMPIPKGVEIVDLALCMGIPKFENVMDNVLFETNIEEYVVASEIAEHNKHLNQYIAEALHGVVAKKVSHEELKEMSKDAKFIIRSGENTPYANIMFTSGVAF